MANIAENFNRLSRVNERYRQTTDKQQTERRQHIANVNVSSLKMIINIKGLSYGVLTYGHYRGKKAQT